MLKEEKRIHLVSLQSKQESTHCKADVLLLNDSQLVFKSKICFNLIKSLTPSAAFCSVSSNQLVGLIIEQLQN